jgi:hypothetical protein
MGPVEESDLQDDLLEASGSRRENPANQNGLNIRQLAKIFVVFDITGSA